MKPRGNRKLTASQVKTIRKSDETCRVLAEKYGVWPMTISLVKRRITWKEVP